MARNLFTTTRRSAWTAAEDHTCLGCKKTFRSQHAAAFHVCSNPPAETQPAPKLSMIGYVNEMGEPVRAERSARADQYYKDGGMELLFSMPAREFAQFATKIQAVTVNGTPADTAKLLREIREMIGV